MTPRSHRPALSNTGLLPRSLAWPSNAEDCHLLVDKHEIPQRRFARATRSFDKPAPSLFMGVLVAIAAHAPATAQEFVKAIAHHRFPERETDPPLV